MAWGQPADKIETLTQVPLFRHLSRRHLEQIAQHVEEVPLAAGQALTREGEAGRECLLIVKGTARVDKDGTTLARRGPGESIGEMALLDGEPRSATVTAETDVDLLVLSSRDFSRLLDSVPDLSRKLLMTLSQRLREADEALVD